MREVGRNDKAFVLLWVAVVIWMAVIFCFSAQNAEISGSQSNEVAVALVKAAEQLGVAEAGASQDAEFMGDLGHCIRKIMHIFEFMLLAVLVFLALYESRFKAALRWSMVWVLGARELPKSTELNKSLESHKKYLIRIMITAFVISVFYAATDEFHQLFVPGRGAQFADVAIDSIGVTVGIIITSAAVYLKIRKQLRGRTESKPKP